MDKGKLEGGASELRKAASLHDENVALKQQLREYKLLLQKAHEAIDELESARERRELEVPSSFRDCLDKCLERWCPEFDQGNDADG